VEPAQHGGAARDLEVELLADAPRVQHLAVALAGLPRQEHERAGALVRQEQRDRHGPPRQGEPERLEPALELIHARPPLRWPPRCPAGWPPSASRSRTAA